MQRFLFDRLCHPLVDTGQDESGRLAFLRQSIVQELQRLFSNRSYFDGVMTGTGIGSSVLNFGLQDLQSLSANFTDSAKLKEQLRQVILKYEPRLHTPEIELVATDDPLMPARIEINGLIREQALQAEFSWHTSSLGEGDE